MNYDEHICISALGAVTPIGNSLEEISFALFEKELVSSALKDIEKFNVNSFVTKKAYIPEIGNEKIKYPSKFNSVKNGELFYTEIALNNLVSNIDLNKFYPKSSVACILGVDKPYTKIENYFSLATDYHNNSSVSKTLNNLRLRDLSNSDPNAFLELINKTIPFSFGLNYVGLCAASTHSIVMAVNQIRSGRSDAVITGGISAKISPMHLIKVDGLGVTANNNSICQDTLCRPFDRKRSGFVIGEGAILFLLEKESQAIERGRQPIIRISGVGTSLCAQHIVAPHTEEKEMLLSMNRALLSSRLSKEDISFVSTHGTSTSQNDLHEAKAIFNLLYSENNKPIISATKSNHGHLMAAAGAMEVLCSIASLLKREVPKIQNTTEIDCEIPKELIFAKDNYLLADKNEIHMLKNSFGMGGVAASLVLSHIRGIHREL